ncbi:MAG: SGNH/GDSL hydrolase family protein [Rhizobiaceae bacterium]|nr:SGNH/GDSL hydrolase family protein [Rhizobiaceae bacterium]
MSPILTSILSWLCFPLYVVQGIYVRQNSLRLSPAVGPRSGQFGKGKPVIKILALGDSSAAAVGIDHTLGAIGPQIARKLHEKSGNTVSWHISGHNSAVAGEIRDHVVPNLPTADYTHIIIMLGTNDMKNWHTVKRWKKEFGTLLYSVRTRYPEAKLFWHQAIDMRKVPALPSALGYILNLRAGLLNRKGAQLCVERGAVCVPPLQDVRPEGYCRDGFHASELGYDAWADHMIEHFDYEPRTSPAAAPFI